MLSTQMEQESVIKRVERVVSISMEENPIFKEDLDYAAIVHDLVKIFEKTLSFDEFNHISDASLKKRCDGIMAVRILAKISEDFTPEQMAIFEDAIKRK